MKHAVLGLIAVVCSFMVAVGVAKSDPYDGTGVYSVATPNCVPAVTALFWWDIGYHMTAGRVLNVTTRLESRFRDEEERKLSDMTPACWLGKASKALGIRHRRLYTPSESKRIVRWFEARGQSF